MDLKSINVPLKEFLKCFFKEDEKICFRVLSDRKDKGFKGLKLSSTLQSIEKTESILKEHNAKNRGVFFAVNYGGHFDKDITRINAQFFECDSISLKEQYQRIMAFPLPPSIIIKTRKSLHTYFLIRDGKVEDFRKIQHDLIEYFDGDKACVNESRLLRLPGFHHCKEEPIKVECIKFDPKIRYTQDELLNVLHIDTGADEPLTAYNQTGVDYVLNHCEFMKHCKENAKTLSEHDWYSMISNLAVFENGKEKIHQLSRDYTGYDYEETENKIKHYLASKTKPITCKTIAEKGFVCPKLQDGDCKVKSPAALSYKDKNTLPKWYEKTKTGVKFLSGLLADYLTENIRAYYTAGNFYFYKDGVYQAVEDIHACSIIKGYMLPNKRTIVNINDTLGQWKIGAYINNLEANSEPYTLNLKNGLYDIQKNELKKHSPNYFSIVQLNAKYDKKAKCNLFLEFLDDILEKDEITLIQEIFGYLLVPINKAQKSFIFVGAPSAGKSTLLSVAQDILLGSENVSNIPWQSLNDRFKTAELYGKLANIFADLPSKNIEDNGTFKALTGEDYLMVERKNKNPFSFKPYTRLLFSCNEIPRNYGDRSEGFYRRLVIIRFNKTIPSNKRDLSLKDKLKDERDGIFLWALEGLRRLIKNQYRFSESVKTKVELEAYRIESNNVLMFLKECCEIAPDYRCFRSELFDRYKAFCKDNGYRAFSQTKFNRDIELNVKEAKRSKDNVAKKNIWKGLKYAEYT